MIMMHRRTDPVSRSISPSFPFPQVFSLPWFCDSEHNNETCALLHSSAHPFGMDCSSSNCSWRWPLWDPPQAVSLFPIYCAPHLNPPLPSLLLIQIVFFLLFGVWGYLPRSCPIPWLWLAGPKSCPILGAGGRSRGGGGVFTVGFKEWNSSASTFF